MKKIIAFALTLILLCSISSAFAATNHVVGTHGEHNTVEDGVDANDFTSNQTSTSVQIEVSAGNIKNKYAVDVDFETMLTTIDGATLTWDVNNLTYVATDFNENTWYTVTITNYSDKAVYVTAAVSDAKNDDNLSLAITEADTPTLKTVNKAELAAAYNGGSAVNTAKTTTFDVYVSSTDWKAVANYYAGTTGAQTVGTCTVTIAKDNA